ncbi:hypothetical protein AHAS_Ahas05G0044400 [Arachis hypogaea]
MELKKQMLLRMAVTQRMRDMIYRKPILWNHNSKSANKLRQGNRNKKHLLICPPEHQHQAYEEFFARQIDSPRPLHWEDDWGALSFSLGISPLTSQPSLPTSQPTVTQLEILAEAVMDTRMTATLQFAERMSVEPSLSTP